MGAYLKARPHVAFVAPNPIPGNVTAHRKDAPREVQAGLTAWD